jgi:putative transposase
VPWSTPDLVTIRKEFIRFVLSGRHHITEACVVFGVSEKTGHKWLNRYRDEGLKGLDNRSHAPYIAAHQVSRQLRDRITQFRSIHPTWGPRKLKSNLERKFPNTQWPAASTIGELLRRQGLVKHRRRKSHPAGKALNSSLTAGDRPNQVWTTDVKGEFRLGSGPYCYPLTVMDYKSRYLLECRALSSTSSDAVKIVFTQIFEEFGMPLVMRSDNGIPFAHPLAIARLSALSIWWIRLGIRPERITPGHPQQNGQHERMHKTLKDESTRPPSASLTRQQKRFDRFRREYNDERPHESLGQNPPADFYARSDRSFPKELPDLIYPAHFELRHVEKTGMVHFRGHHFWLSKTLIGQALGLEETEADMLTVHFGPLSLGTYDLPSRTFIAESIWNDTSPSGLLRSEE